MTAVKDIEYQITRQLMRRRERGIMQRGAVQQGIMQQGIMQQDTVQQSAAHWQTYRTSSDIWADRLIAILALTTGMLVLGSYLEELLWAAMAATTLVTLR